MDTSQHSIDTAKAGDDNTRRARRRVGAASAGGVLTILAVTIVAVVATGFTPSRSRLLDGGAWLADSENMAHASGPNAAVDAAVQRCPDAEDCKWAQRDGLAYLVQAASGQAHRLDTTTRAFDEQGVSIGGPGTRLLVGTGRVYSIDPNHPEVTSRDPQSLQPRGAPVRVEGGAGDAMVDRAGALWVIETGTGNLLGLDDQEVRYTIRTGASGRDLSLGSIDDEPIVLDRGSGVVIPVDDRGHAQGRISTAGFDPQRTVLGQDLPPGPLLMVERGSGRVANLALDSGQLEDLGRMEVGDDVGGAFRVGRNVFVSQPSEGLVRWYSTDDRVEHEPIGEAVDVFVKDGYLFANAPTATEAHVAGPDSDPQPVLKRRPDIPKGEVKPEQNTYSPTPISVTTTTQPSQDVGQSEAGKAGTSTTSSTSTPSPVGSSTTLPGMDNPPQPPTKVHGDGADSEATVTWSSSPGNIKRYEIEAAGGSADFAPQKVEASSACKGGDCSVLVKPLTNGNTYSFVVYAVDVRDNRSAPSQPSNDTPVDALVPGSPSNVRAKGTANNSAQVSWNRAGEGPGGRPVALYEITVLDQNMNPTLKTAQSTGTQTEVPGLEAWNGYYFRVTARNDAGKLGAATTSNAVATPFAKPGPLSGISVSAGGCGAANPDSSITAMVSYSGFQQAQDSATNEVTIRLNGFDDAGQGGTGSGLVDIAAGRQARIEVAARNDADTGDYASAPVLTCDVQDPSSLLSIVTDPQGSSV